MTTSQLDELDDPSVHAVHVTHWGIAMKLTMNRRGQTFGRLSSLRKEAQLPQRNSAPRFILFLDSTLFRLNSTFWLDCMLKLYYAVEQ